MVTHALGAMDQTRWLNAKEAFEEYYQKGNRVFEFDVQKSSDGIWVCRHDWSEPRGQWDGDGEHILSAEEFVSRPLLESYTAMTFRDFLLLLKEYPDAYAMLDTKMYDIKDYQIHYQTYSELVQVARQADALDVLQQLIPQIYNEEMFSAVKTVYPFSNYVYTVMKVYPNVELKKMAAFCRKSKIPAVVINCKRWNTDFQKIFEKQGISVYVYNLNTAKSVKKYFAQGIKGVFTDWLTEDQIQGISD